MRPVRALVSAAALSHNLARVRQLAPHSAVMAVLKADAYGHGLLRSAAALCEADGFGLLDLDEALVLRQAGYRQPICLLEGFFDADELTVIAERQIDTVVHSAWQIDALASSQATRAIDVWLKLDTGMHRLGFHPEEATGAYRRLRQIPQVGRIACMSHLASADDRADNLTNRQLHRFSSSLATEKLVRSLANSAAIAAWPGTHLDWVRPGIMLYGGSPLADTDAAALDLRAAMTLESQLIATRDLRRGDSVGYGASWTCPEDMRIGVVACGYGDGYPRHAPSGTPVLVDGRNAPLVGRVSMDMITVDLRGHPGARVGSPVELWGSRLPVDTVARQAGTIAYELLCGVTGRVRRVNQDDGEQD